MGRVTKRTGGKVIAEGAYGCVVTPPPKCAHALKDNPNVDHNASSSKVAKLFNDHDSMVEEFKLAEEISKMDKEGRWSTPIYQSCALQAKDLQRDDRETCEVTNQLHDNEVVSYIVMEYGGPSLEMYIEQKKRISLNEFCFIFETCLLGLISLHRKHFMHLDIKPGNVLYDAKAGKCYLIDFSLMRSTYEPLYATDNKSILAHPYLWYPPEFYILNKAESPKDLQKISSSELISRVQKVYGRHGFFTPIELELMVTEATEFIGELEKRTKTSTWSVLNNPRYLNQVDIFSLGMTMKELYEVCVHDNNKFKSMDDLIDSMICGNVFQRATDPQAYDALMRIVRRVFKVPTLLNANTSVNAAMPSMPNIKNSSPSKKTPETKKGIAAAITKLFTRK